MRVLTFAKTGEVLRIDGSYEAVFLSQLTLPFSKNRVALLPIVLLGRRELFGVIRLCLAGADWFGDGEHTALPSDKVER
jgi:hypothetical protein